MFRLHKYFGKQAFFAIIMAQLLALSHARVISQCSSEAGEIMPNTDATCNTQYPYIYCNGASSAYCTRELCLEENECNNEAIAEVPSAPAPAMTPGTTAPAPATTAPGSVPVVTPPTVAPSTAQPITPPTVAPSPAQPITPPTTAPAPATTAPVPAPALPITPPTVAPEPALPITPPTVAPAPAQPITPPTVAPAPAQPITAPTVAPAPAQTTTETTATIREKCTTNKEFSVPYIGNCRYFYHCVNGYFGIGDCGFNMYFDVNESDCKIRTQTSCQ